MKVEDIQAAMEFPGVGTRKKGYKSLKDEGALSPAETLSPETIT